MAGWNLDSLRVAPGRLSYGCTDLTAAWPHGGTGLGVVRGVDIEPRGTYYPATAEAFGGEPIEYFERGEIWGLSTILLGWDADAVQQVFPNATAGTTTQRGTAPAPGSVEAGNWLSDRALTPLVFTPEGSTHAQSDTAPDAKVPFFLLYKALPLLQAQRNVQMRVSQDFGIPVVFMGIRNSSGNLKDQGMRRDLSL